MIVTVSLFCIVVVFCLVKWLLEKMRKWNSRQPPLLPGYLPIIGHTHLFVGDTIHLWNKIKEVAHYSLASGGIVKVTSGPWKIYMMTDPEECYQIAQTCLQKDGVYDVAKPWLGEGLVTASVDIWKRHRKLVNPGFNQYILDGYLTVFNSSSRKLVDALADKVGTGYFDHISFLEKTALEIICLTAMGIDDMPDSTNKGEYLESVAEIFHLFVKRVQTHWMKSDLLFRWTSLKKKQDQMIRILRGLSNEVIQRRKLALKKTRENNHAEYIPKRIKSFLDLLLEDGSLSDKEIREEVDTMISAGYDTSATLLTFTLVLLGSYPEVQEKVYKEIESVFEGSDRDVEKEDLVKMVYLEAVMKEVLRLYPVVPLIARYMDKDVELKNYTLSTGASSFFLVYGINRHPVWGPDADQFRPERWLNPAELPANANAFAGFGLGRRSCIGSKFALMSTRTTICHFLRKYRVFADHTKMVLKIDIMLKSDSGHHVRIEKR